MRLSSPFIFASVAAIVVGGLMLWIHQEYVLNLSFIFSTVPLREVYRNTALPPSIQNYVNYRYVLGLVFAVAAFGATYFGMTFKSSEREIISVCFLAPTIVNYVFIFTIFLTPFLILGLFIRTILLYVSDDNLRFRPYLFCFMFNCISAIAIYVHVNEAFQITS